MLHQQYKIQQGHWRLLCFMQKTDMLNVPIKGIEPLASPPQLGLLVTNNGNIWIEIYLTISNERY